ncbi:uncharacterized protein LOC130015245 [Mercurialis annua]|uniref:uncharacterized protein LOC130015245 n=1 Tax=Mercurialis annua TaxID=3986 RepID=UPI0024AD5A16|nr:uncharacterized protein LOC130015245 [Mercurialis annua]
MVSTRSTPTKEKKDFVVPVKMKRKLVKKAEKDVEGSGVASASENVKVKGKKVDETGLKKRRLAFDAVPDHQKVQKSLHIEEPTRLVQNWDYLLDAEDRYTCRVTIPLNFKYIEDIKKTLSDTQLELFKKTFLGHFLDLSPLCNQPQLIHSLLLREVKHPNNRELWFKVSGHKLRFSIDEFAVITGLNCVGDFNPVSYAPLQNQLIDTYFPNSEVTRDGLGVIFLNKVFKSDEDAVKLAVIYLFECYLCSNEIKFQNVSRFFMDMVDSGDYNSYPWGIMVFRSTIADMKKRFATRRRLKFYRLNSFPLALQIWFYEVCPFATNKICFPVTKPMLVPRMLKWLKSQDKLTIKYLNEAFFDQTREQLMLKNIVPTAQEKMSLDISGFFQTGKKKIVEDLDFSTDDDAILADYLKCKQVESSRRRKTFNLLKSRLNGIESSQLKIKSEFSSLKTEVRVIYDCMTVIGDHFGLSMPKFPKSVAVNEVPNDDDNMGVSDYNFQTGYKDDADNGEDGDDEYEKNEEENKDEDEKNEEEDKDEAEDKKDEAEDKKDEAEEKEDEAEKDKNEAENKKDESEEKEDEAEEDKEDEQKNVEDEKDNDRNDDGGVGGGNKKDDDGGVGGGNKKDDDGGDGRSMHVEVPVEDVNQVGLETAAGEVCCVSILY